MARKAMNPGAQRVAIVYCLAFVLSACSLLYELLIAHSLVTLAGNTVVWYSLTIGIYLAAMGIGALLLEARGTEPHRDTWSRLYSVEILLTLVGGLAVFVIHFGHMLHLYLFAQSSWASSVPFFATAFLTIPAVGLLTGLELPLLIRLGNELSEQRVTNRVLGADYMGALVGACLFPLVFLPRFELMAISIFTAVVNLLVTVFLLCLFASRTRRTLGRALVSGALAIGIGSCALNLPAVEQYFLKKYYYFFLASDDFSTLLAPMPELHDVIRTSSPYQKIDLVYDEAGYLSDAILDAYSTKFIEEPDFPGDWALFLNGVFQVLSNSEEIYHEFFAHVPIQLHGAIPRHPLVMGAGDGLLLRELLKYDSVEAITHVDLDPELVRMAREDPRLVAMNHRALHDPRVRTIVGDAYQYARQSREKFDAIYLDFPVAFDYDLSKLYSSEFFHFVGELLADGGFAVLTAAEIDDSERRSDDRIELASESDWQLFSHTFRKAGFQEHQLYFSYIEFENPRAQAILEQQWEAEEGEGAEEKTARIREFLRDHCERSQLPFIVLWKQPRELNREYRDLGIGLHVLNERRFRGALDFEASAWDEIDPRQVNSIMRPTLPNIPFWNVRVPW